MPGFDQHIGAYEGDGPFTFVSYSHLDSELVYPHLKGLQQLGLNLWFDEGISPGHRWTEDLAIAIQACTAFLFFVTPRSVTSEHCINEVQFAVGRRKPVLAVHLEPTELPPHLELSIGHRQAILACDLDPEVTETKIEAGLRSLIKGDSARSMEAPVPSVRASPSGIPLRRMGVAIAVATALVVVAFAYLWWGASKTAVRSLAVLPFNNYGEPSRDYLADGVADGLISQLGNVPGIRVASRASSFALREVLQRGAIDMAALHRRLGVRYILEGSIRPGTAEGQVLVNVRIVDAETDSGIWSADWDTARSTVLDIQSDIAQQVARVLVRPADGSDVAQLVTAGTVNPGAYEDYLLGRDLLRQPHAPDVIDAAEAHFQTSLRADDQFALAHAGLCEVYVARYLLNMDRVPFVLAQKSCDRALNLDPEQWEVRLSLGELYRQAGDYTRSLEEIERAVELAPGEAEARIARGWTLDRLGQTIQAEAAFVKAVELEPGYWGGYKELANFYYDHVEYDKALNVYQEVLDLVQDDTTVRYSIGAVYLAKGEFQKALDTFELVGAKQGTPTRATLTNLGLTYYYMGCFEEAATFQKRATIIAPDDHRVWGRMAESCRFVDGGETQALSIWRRAVELANAAVNQASWETRGLLGIYEAHLGDAVAARKEISAMWRLHPEASVGHFFEAIVEARAGDPEAARRSRAASLEAGFPVALMDNDPDLSPRRACALPERLPYGTSTCSLDTNRPTVNARD